MGHKKQNKWMIMSVNKSPIVQILEIQTAQHVKSLHTQNKVFFF